MTDIPRNDSESRIPAQENNELATLTPEQHFAKNQFAEAARAITEGAEVNVAANHSPLISTIRNVPEEGKQPLLDAIEKLANNDHAKLVLGDLYRRAGNPDQACIILSQLSESQEIAKGEALRIMGLAKSAKGPEDSKEGISLLKQGIQEFQTTGDILKVCECMENALAIIGKYHSDLYTENAQLVQEFSEFIETNEAQIENPFLKRNILGAIALLKLNSNFQEGWSKYVDLLKLDLDSEMPKPDQDTYISVVCLTALSALGKNLDNLQEGEEKITVIAQAKEFTNFLKQTIQSYPPTLPKPDQESFAKLIKQTPELANDLEVAMKKAPDFFTD